MLRYDSKVVAGVFLALLMVVALGPAARAATPEGLSAKQVAALEQRVRERWQALSDRDYGKAWEYSTPIYRSVFPNDLYVLQFSYAVDRELTEVEVTHYDAAAAVASVTARVMSKPLKQTLTASASMGAVPVIVKERWILVDDEWWFSASG